MIVVADLPLPAIITTGGAIVLAILGLVSYIVRAIFKYLIDRVALLEGRQTDLLDSAVDSLKQQGSELTAQGTLIRELAKQDERRAWERERERGGRP